MPGEIDGKRVKGYNQGSQDPGKLKGVSFTTHGGNEFGQVGIPVQSRREGEDWVKFFFRVNKDDSVSQWEWKAS